MKKFLSILAICATVCAVSCKIDNSEPEVKKIIKTTAISPEEGEAGTEVRITGENFDNTVAVFFGEAKATVSSASETVIAVTAPENEPGEYAVKVVIGDQSASNLKFTYLDTKLAVTAISSEAGYDQDELTITGKNFNAVAGLNSVKFGDVPAVVTNATATELTVEVPVNETGASYDVTVTVGEQTATAPVQFKYNKDVYKGQKKAVDLGFAAGENPKVYDVEFLKDGRLAMGTKGGSIYLYDFEKKTYETLLDKSDGRRAHGLTQNPVDGKLYVAFQGWNYIASIDPDTKEYKQLVTGLPVVMQIKFDKDNNMYANCCNEGIVYKWAAGTYSSDKSDEEIRNAKVEFAKFDTKVKCMDFDNDGNLIVGLLNEAGGAASIWSVDKTGNKKIIAGSTTEKPNGITLGDYRQPLTARFNTGILGIMVDSRGCIWFSDHSMMTYLLKPGKKGYEDASVSAIHSSANGWADGAQPEGYAQNPKAEGVEVYIADLNRYGVAHRAWLEVE